MTKVQRIFLVMSALATTLVAAGFAGQAGVDTWVAFQFKDQVGAPTETTPVESFDTPPKLRLAVAGDVGTGGSEAHKTAAAIDQLEGHDDYAALLLLGDNVYPNGDPDQIQRAVFDPFAEVLDGSTELVAALGNHDVRDGHGDAHADAIGMPSRWYATRLGDVLILTLDSTRPDDPDQRAWADETLRASDAIWKIAMMHHPPYSGGYHGSELTLRETYKPLFESTGVQLVLAGHEHDYQRSKEIDGVTYIVSGAAAKTRPAVRADFTEQAWSTYHFLDISVWEDRLLVRAIDSDGRQFDELHLRT